MYNTVINLLFPIHNPLTLIAYVLAFVNLYLALVSLLGLFKAQDHNQIKTMDRNINNILLVCFFMLFFAFLDSTIYFIRGFFSIARSGPALPEVFAGAIINFFVPLFAIVCLCSFYMIVWFFLRAYHRRMVERNASMETKLKKL